LKSEEQEKRSEKSLRKTQIHAWEWRSKQI